MRSLQYAYINFISLRRLPDEIEKIHFAAEESRLPAHLFASPLSLIFFEDAVMQMRERSHAGTRDSGRRQCAVDTRCAAGARSRQNMLRHHQVMSRAAQRQ